MNKMYLRIKYKLLLILKKNDGICRQRRLTNIDSRGLAKGSNSLYKPNL